MDPAAVGSNRPQDEGTFARWLRTPAVRVAATVVIGLPASVAADRTFPRGNELRILLPGFIIAMVPFLITVLTRRREPIPRTLGPYGDPSTPEYSPGGVAYLLTDRCTTGWLHWMPGELWLTPDAIVRVRPGFRSAFVPEMDLGAQTDATALKYAQAVSSTRSSPTYIPLADIRSARLRAGRSTDRLALDTYTGARYKFLFPREDQAFRVLRDQLWDREVAGYALD